MYFKKPYSSMIHSLHNIFIRICSLVDILYTKEQNKISMNKSGYLFTNTSNARGTDELTSPPPSPYFVIFYNLCYNIINNTM